MVVKYFSWAAVIKFCVMIKLNAFRNVYACAPYNKANGKDDKNHFEAIYDQPWQNVIF